MKNYGKELILDIHEIQNTHLFNRKDLKKFFIKLCKEINMVRQDLHFWDYEGLPKQYVKAPAHLKGTSAVQFIKTSNVTVHTLDELKRVYLNIFSCKSFNARKAKKFCLNWFGGKVVNEHVMERI